MLLNIFKYIFFALINVIFNHTYKTYDSIYNPKGVKPMFSFVMAELYKNFIFQSGLNRNGWV